MAFAASQEVVYNIGSVTRWLNRTDLRGRRIRLIDLEDQVVGRASAVIANVLQGKDRPDYSATLDRGDVVVAINADKAIMTGKKMEEKLYYRHSGKPGNLKTTTPEELKKTSGGAAIVWKAVNGMLPKNRLQKRRMDRILIYNDDRHNFDESYMFPLDMPARKVRRNKLRWPIPDGFKPMNAAAYFNLWKADDPEWQAKLKEVLVENAKELEGAPSVDTDSGGLGLRQGLRIQ